MGARLRSIFGGSIGNLIEWYDFYVYNAFALYFAKQFAGAERERRRSNSSMCSRSTRSAS